MARSEAEICNMALQRVGVTMTVDKLDDRTKEATVLNKIFNATREKVLSDAPWPFARKYQALNRTGTAPRKWAYIYAYPNDCLAVRAIFPDLGANVEPAYFRKYIREHKIPFEVITDDRGDKFICCDISTAIIEMTVNVTNVTRFNAKFDSAFAWALAAEVALPLSRDVKYSQNAFQMYERGIAEAQAAAFNEEVKDDAPESEFVRERG